MCFLKCPINLNVCVFGVTPGQLNPILHETLACRKEDLLELRPYRYVKQAYFKSRRHMIERSCGSKLKSARPEAGVFCFCFTQCWKRCWLLFKSLKRNILKNVFFCLFLFEFFFLSFPISFSFLKFLEDVLSCLSTLYKIYILKKNVFQTSLFFIIIFSSVCIKKF